MKQFSNFLTFNKSSKDTQFLFIKLVLALFIIVFSLTSFADLAEDTLFEQDMLQFDTIVSHYIYSFRTPQLTEFMSFISVLGLEFTLIVGSLIFISLFWYKHKRSSVLFAVMFIFGGLLNFALKNIFKRGRPEFDPILSLTTYSFPSGHAMNSFVFYSLIAYLTYRVMGKKRLSVVVSIICALLILLIGISRVYLGVHYPSDIIAGYLAGFGWFTLVLFIEKSLTYRRLYREFNESIK